MEQHGRSMRMGTREFDVRFKTGNLPNEEIDDRFDLATLHLPEDLPVSLLSKLVQQRPDIRAAEELASAYKALR